MNGELETGRVQHRLWVSSSLLLALQKILRLVGVTMNASSDGISRWSPNSAFSRTHAWRCFRVSSSDLPVLANCPQFGSFSQGYIRRLYCIHLGQLREIYGRLDQVNLRLRMSRVSSISYHIMTLSNSWSRFSTIPI